MGWIASCSCHGLSTYAKYIAKNDMDCILLLLASRWVQDGPRWSQDGPKMPQDGPKMAPRWPQDGSRWPKMAPSGGHLQEAERACEAKFGQMPNSCVESGKVCFTPQKIGSSELHCFCRKQAYPELPIFNGSNDSLKFSSNAAHSQGVRSLTTDSEKQVHAGFLMFNEFRHLFDPFLGLSWAILGPTCGHPEPT